ncbi:MAG TPA: SpoIIE family protein phosphatase [Candidatus Limnocylindrales bacterium]|jgi:serine phosphatase RsbU (regulator of sigma subunit)/anti-sigma regulatory factor (Ser/Thr protein kinase)
MIALPRPIRRLFGRGSRSGPATPASGPATPASGPGLPAAASSAVPIVVPGPAAAVAADRAPDLGPSSSIVVDIPESDPLLAYLQSTPGPVDVARLDLDSPATRAMREAGVALIVPLVSQGELIGTLNLGPRLSEQEYSTDDRRLLSTLAAQAAPAIRVAQLVREQADEAAERERLAQELRVATLIQQQFLPRQLPQLPQWQVAAYYGPARAVGGDFYDFVEMPDGRIGIAVGDVTDKGVPAALVMARTHSILRAEASRSTSPGEILARANDLLVPEMPSKMFVTCLFAILDPATGHIVVANAGHNLPMVRSGSVVSELRATGLPLGLLPGMRYEETEGDIAADSNVLLYSDGLVEAHDRSREMFGFDRLRDAMHIDDAGSELLDRLLETLRGFTGPDHEQEDDITLVTLRRAAGVAGSHADEAAVVTAFTLPGAQGNEREAMDRVAAAIADLGLAPERLERLKTAVSEASMNAIEYGSRSDPDVPFDVLVEITADDVVVRVTDRALSGPVPTAAEAPDIERKLAGEQKPRGWGLFLIEHMVDAMDVSTDESAGTQTVTLRLAREERPDG